MNLSQYSQIKTSIHFDYMFISKQATHKQTNRRTIRQTDKVTQQQLQAPIIYLCKSNKQIKNRIKQFFGYFYSQHESLSGAQATVANKKKKHG